MRCFAQPYEGNEDYIFFSYAHADKGIAYGMIETMARRGYRVWYDSGLNPGDDWPEVIGTHLQGSKVCLCLMTGNAIQSHNCRNELNYAVESGKIIIPVLIGNPLLSPGIRLQLSSFHQFRCGDRFDMDMMEGILASEAVRSCLGAPDPEIEVHEIVIAPAEQEAPREDDRLKKDYFSAPKPAPEAGAADGPGGRPADSEPETPPVLTHGRPTPDESAPGDDLYDEDEGDKTIVEAIPAFDDDDDDNDATIVISQPVDLPPVVVCLEDGRRFRGQPVATKLGRGGGSDIVLYPQDRTIGREHVRLLSESGRNYVFDLDSKNGTSVNGQPLESGGQAEVGDCAQVTMAKRKLFVAFGEEARALWQASYLGSLTSEKTQETIYFFQGRTMLGRNWRWPSGAMSARNISHDHGAVIATKEGFAIEDHSQNGTFVNDVRIDADKPCALSPGDVIRLGDELFDFDCVTLEKREEYE